ncbi:MAG TPA: VTT domain-containing protein [Marmoricola sp.]|nr:VTT domain-containing protein [Marmoricola sp.]
MLLLTFGFGAVSAVIPIFNMEAYISVVYARDTAQSAWAIAAIGSLGQNVGKLVWYYASREALDIPWLKRRMSKPKRQAQYQRWSGFVQGRPGTSFALTFLSAAIGFPPFFAMAMVAGTLRMNVVVFFVAGLLGRTLFFMAWLLGVGLIFH